MRPRSRRRPRARARRPQPAGSSRREVRDRHQATARVAAEVGDPAVVGAAVGERQLGIGRPRTPTAARSSGRARTASRCSLSSSVDALGRVARAVRDGVHVAPLRRRAARRPRPSRPSGRATPSDRALATAGRRARGTRARRRRPGCACARSRKRGSRYRSQSQSRARARDRRRRSCRRRGSA